jgi:hypothetical protein
MNIMSAFLTVYSINNVKDILSKCNDMIWMDDLNEQIQGSISISVPF